MQTGTATILVVEDDPSLQCSLRTFFEDHGYPVHAAGTRREGCELLRRLRPAICLLDLNLPDGSGVDILRTIVEEKLPVRVIVMSAYPMEHLRHRFPATTLVASMTKPVLPDDLLEMVEKVTSGAAG